MIEFSEITSESRVEDYANNIKKEMQCKITKRANEAIGDLCSKIASLDATVENLDICEK